LTCKPESLAIQGGAMGFLMGSLVRPDSPGLGQAAAKAGQDPGNSKFVVSAMGEHKPEVNITKLANPD
jgi:hypothetical protein